MDNNVTTTASRPQTTTAQLYLADLPKLNALASADGITQRELLHRLIEKAFSEDTEAMSIFDRTQANAAKAVLY